MSAPLSDLPLARSLADRQAVRRHEPGLIATLLGHQRTGIVLVHQQRVAMSGDRLATVPLSELASLTPQFDWLVEHGLWLYLGSIPDGGQDRDHRDVVALVLSDVDLALPQLAPDDESTTVSRIVDHFAWASLVDVGDDLDDLDVGLATTAVALAAWHGSSTFCPRCGSSASEIREAGWVRRCPSCGADLYPRTDPAVIMAVTDAADRLLLGHASHWPAGRYSTLAGFVEAGETPERAVRREVGEEADIVVGDVTYVGSQPWPFPQSLMLAFEAKALSTAISVDGAEVTDARWFTREQLCSEVASGEVRLPMRSSIARALIERWLGRRLDEPPVHEVS